MGRRDKLFVLNVACVTQEICLAVPKCQMRLMEAPVTSMCVLACEFVAGKGIGSHVPAVDAAMAVIAVMVTVDPVLWGIGA